MVAWDGNPVPQTTHETRCSSLDLITTVRNNLFHGGKKVTGMFAERDYRLVQSSLVILAHAIGLGTNVQHAFEELPPEQDTA